MNVYPPDARTPVTPTNGKPKPFRGLHTKIVLPIIVVMTALGVGLYVFTLGFIFDIAKARIQEDLERSSRAVYSICDTALQELLAAGLVTNEAAGRIRKGRTLGDVEEYLRQHDLKAVVYSGDGADILFSSEPAAATHNVISQAKTENAVLMATVDDRDYYVRHFRFELWNWHIILIKDAAVYAGVIRQVQGAYLITASMIVIAGLLLVYYLRRFIRNPIRSIVTSIERGGLPTYKGVYEFEFLSGTIREQTQALRAAKEKAERASLAKTRFLASASHDLRQPMHTVSLLVGVLKEQRLAPEDRELVDKIQRAVSATEVLFENLLEISKLDAGAIKPNVGEFPIGDLLRLTEANYGPQASSKNLQLRIVPSSALVRSDPALLGSVINNLVSNAIRYTDRGKILVGCRRHADRLIVQVLDTGIGIPEEKLDEIFEEFVQLAGAGKERKTGLGLGLSIAKRSAELLGHPLHVRSVVGRGSVFSIDLPRATETTRPTFPEQSLADTSADLAGLFVVVIDDDAENILATEKLCQQWGCKVLAARSAREAIDGLREHLRTPDLIISDYDLRDDINGLSAVQSIRDLAQEDIPAIIVTGDVSLAHDERLSSRTSVIHKPVNADKLHRCIAEHVWRDG